jgi:DNA-binding response OmpR family regulator
MSRPLEHMAPIEHNTLSILVVEDDRAVAESFRTILNDVPGWGATIVHDASAARAVFRHVQIELLVVDVNLPGISGLELLTLLRREPRWNEPPIVLLSADAAQAGITAAVQDGLVTTFLQKPFDVDRLVHEIRVAASVAQDGPFATREHEPDD